MLDDHEIPAAHQGATRTLIAQHILGQLAGEQLPDWPLVGMRFKQAR